MRQNPVVNRSVAAFIHSYIHISNTSWVFTVGQAWDAGGTAMCNTDQFPALFSSSALQVSVAEADWEFGGSVDNAL